MKGRDERGRRAAIPARLDPQLATLVDRVPEDDGWIYETKYDGYRMLCRVSNGKARLFTRNGEDWTTKLDQHARAAADLPLKGAWLDGEVVVVKPDGTTSFQALQNAFNRAAQASIFYYLFDLPYADGRDLRKLPLIERKELLAERLRNANEVLRYSEHVESAGRAFFDEACRDGLEGVIGKRGDSAYASGRSRSWIKLKCRRRQEFVIAGFTDPRGAREAFGAILLGVHDDDGALRYAGKVGTGFSNPSLRVLRERLLGLASDKTPLVDPPSGKGAHGVHWIKPRLVAEIAFSEWTNHGLIRQGSFEGLREDKPATRIVREKAVAPRNK